MEMIKKELLLVCLLALLAGCRQRNSLSFEAMGSPFTLIIPVGRRDMAKAEQQARDIALDLEEEGFMVTIEPFNKDNSDSEHEYARLLEERLSDPRTFAFLMDFMEDTVREAVPLGDLSSRVPSDSPYGDFAGEMLYRTAPLIPLESMTLHLNNVILLEKKTFYAYGQEIHTSEEYTAFLEWAKGHTDLQPGTIYRGIDTGSTEITLMNWLLPPLGYIPLDPIMNYPLFLALDGDGRIVQVDKTPVYPDLLGEINRLNGEGLMDFSLSGAVPTDWEGSASFLLSDSDFRTINTMPPLGYKGEDFLMSYLNPRSGLSMEMGSYAAMGPEGEPDEFLRLLDWLFEKWENFDGLLDDTVFSGYFSDLLLRDPDLQSSRPEGYELAEEILVPLDPELIGVYQERAIDLVMEYDREFNSRNRIARVRSSQVETTLLLASRSADILPLDRDFDDFSDICYYLETGKAP